MIKFLLLAIDSKNKAIATSTRSESVEATASTTWLLARVEDKL